MLGVYVSGISGAHINPAVTLANWYVSTYYLPTFSIYNFNSNRPKFKLSRTKTNKTLFSVYRKHPWRKFPVYLVAQVLGAMCAAAVVYGNYKSAIDTFEGGPNM